VSGQSFGGGLDFGTLAGMLPTVPVDSLGGGSIHRAANGSLNYFANPGAALKSFRPALIASDTNDGRNSPLRGLGFWNLDLRVGKSTAITERVKVEFSADLFNAFNHPNFLDPSFDTTNPATFGVISTQLIPADRISGARWIQLGFRIDF